MNDDLTFMPPRVESAPAVIRPEHKKKRAVIYLRQSSLAQVRYNTGSTESQRSLARLPLEWGWPPELIEVIEDDLGLSGTSSRQRKGLLRIEAMMDRDEVGLVIVRDAARLSRDPFDGERFLKKALRAGVLLEENGQLIDLARSRPAEMFGVRLHNLLAWWDNQQRRQTFQAAKDAKIHQGRAISRPQPGYVDGGKGSWIKDPDADVREVIQQIKDRYLEFWSTRKTAIYLDQHGFRRPKRFRGRLEWKRITWSWVHAVLSNPNYTADYHYGRRRLVQTDDSGRTHSEKRPPDQWKTIRNHHEPYFTLEEWERIQSMLLRGAKRQPAAGRGAGLLQGLVACGRCEGRRWMRTRYDRRSISAGPGRGGRYCCYPSGEMGQLLHPRMSCSAPGLDHVVLLAVLDAVTPVGIDAALMAARESEGHQEAADLARQRELHRAEERVLDLKRHYLSVDPSRRTLKVELEQDLEKLVSDRDALRRAYSVVPAVAAITSADAGELLALAGALKDLWYAPTTTNEDRKHILGTVVSKVILHDSTDETFDVEIRWASGLSERQQILKTRGGTALVKQMREAGRPVSEIMEAVTARGLTTQRGKLFDRKGLQHKLYMLGFDMKRPRLEALQLIRSLLLEQRSRKEILETLQKAGPQPYEGGWTMKRIVTAIKSIVTGAWAPEIAPLPADVPRLRRLPPEAIQIFAHGRRMGWSFRQIADDLNALGFRTPRNLAFTPYGAYQLYVHLKKDPSLAGRLPDKAPLPPFRADGQPRRKSGRPPGTRKTNLLNAAQPEETR